MSKTTSQVLREAADLIEPEGAWTQAATARNQAGESVLASSPDAVCWCAVGALIHVGGPWIVACDVAATSVGSRTLPGYNDHFRRTQAEVVAALRAAADRAEASA